MSVVAYGKLRGLENRHLKRVFGPKREEVIGGYTTLSSLIFIFCHMQGYFLERCLRIVNHSHKIFGCSCHQVRL
jgi:hypothetical protein